MSYWLVGLFVTREIQLGSDNVIVIALLLQRMSLHCYYNEYPLADV